MYQPPHFRVEDRARLFEVIRANPLALLVTAGTRGLIANPIPLMLAGEPGQERLIGHLARANEQWRDIATGAEPLAVFQSVEHYVSPGWYPTKRETGKVVPTWNYVVVQVRGLAQIDESPAALRAHVEALTRKQEQGRAPAWTVDDAPADFVTAQLRSIVALTISIREITGKFKLSQNRPVADIAGVHAGLAGESAPDAAKMRAMIGADLARRAASSDID